MMNKKLSLGLLLMLSFFLTGCDSEPSDADVSKAMQSFTEEMNKGAPSESARVVFNSAKKIACKDKDSDGGYRCTVEYNAKIPFLGERTSTMELKFFKFEGKWKVSPSK
ncbi:MULTISPECIES: hypothetical protein [Pectobacterium]|nr:MULTISPECIES: hypothetical protein [Pectobacterium]MDC9818496.1 hypothetical protein [Pectobacterium polonicum]MDK9422129.1 hypothetical protein [Pectobacterium carotovorum]